MDAAGSEFPNMRAFQFRTNPDTPGAKNAAVVIENEARVRHVDGQFGEVVGEADGADAQGRGHRLKFAMSVGDADRANVVSLDQQQFHGDAAIARQFRRVGRDRHAFLDGSGACREEPLDAGDFDQANPARADCGQAVQVAQRRNVLAVGLGRLQDGLAFQRADQFSVDSDR